MIDAYQVPGTTTTTTTTSSSSRRDFMFQKIPTTTILGTTGILSTIIVASSTTSPAYADDNNYYVGSCPPRSSNCIRTTWTPPPSSTTSRKDIALTIRSVLESYPQEGQNKIDLGGYTIVKDELDSSSSAGGGIAHIEYKSGIGNFAKFLNGGKPFIDDLDIEITNDGVVQVKSASRIGDSDLDVNRKRLQYLATALIEKGWSIPEPKY